MEILGIAVITGSFELFLVVGVVRQAVRAHWEWLVGVDD